MLPHASHHDAPFVAGRRWSPSAREGLADACVCAGDAPSQSEERHRAETGCIVPAASASSAYGEAGDGMPSGGSLIARAGAGLPRPPHHASRPASAICSGPSRAASIIITLRSPSSSVAHGGRCCWMASTKSATSPRNGFTGWNGTGWPLCVMRPSGRAPESPSPMMCALCSAFIISLRRARDFSPSSTGLHELHSPGH